MFSVACGGADECPPGCVDSFDDEIGQLLFSMKQMETDMNANINTLIDTKVALKESEAKAQSMQELAIKDALTGIRNWIRPSR